MIYWPFHRITEWFWWEGMLKTLFSFSISPVMGLNATHYMRLLRDLSNLAHFQG